jgi:DNA-binding transcriptional LysR family regulator
VEHRLAGRATLSFGELADESFIVNPAVAAAEPPPRWLEEQRGHGLPGRVAAASTSIEEILTLVASGRGVCLVPRAVARQYLRRGISYVPMSDAEPAVVSLAWRPGSLLPIGEAFVAAATEVAAGQAGELASP